MIFKHSIKNLSRSRGKTLLFFILITVVTLILSLSLSTSEGINAFLRTIDERYTTTAIIEYIGGAYPRTDVSDEYLSEVLETLDLSKFENEYSIDFEPVHHSYGHIDGYLRTDKHASNTGYSVFVLSDFTSTNLATVKQVLYSSTPKRFEGTLVRYDCDIPLPDPHGTYIVAGKVIISGENEPPLFAPILESEAHKRLELERDYGLELSSFLQSLYESSVSYFEQIPDDIVGNIPADSTFYDIARYFDMSNNRLFVTGTTNLQSLYEFNQLSVYINTGRAFTQDEYDSGARVCIVSKFVADKLGKTLGDTVKLSTLSADGRAFDEVVEFGDAFATSDDYEIVGILNHDDNFSFNVYIPYNESIAWQSSPWGYTIGQTTLRNDYANEYLDKVEPMLPELFIATVYDQGYADVVAPLRSILRITTIVSIVCTLAALAILALFGLLFVLRQKQTASIMLGLGTTKKQLISYFLYGTAAVAFTATLIGSLVGFLLSSLTSKAVEKIVMLYSIVDARFSVTRMSKKLDIVYSSEPDFALFAVVGGAIFLCALITCVIFTIPTLTAKQSKPHTRGPRRQMKSSTAFKGKPAKYAALSGFRSGARSLVPVVLAVAAVFLIGQLCNTEMNCRREIKNIEENTVVTGMFTGYDGRAFEQLWLLGRHINTLKSSGYVEDLATYVLFDNVSQSEDEPPLLHNGAQVNFDNTKLYFTDKFETTGELAFARNLKTTFLEGFDSESLGKNFLGGYAYAVVSDKLLERLGLELGAVLTLHAEGLTLTEISLSYGITCSIDPKIMIIGTVETNGQYENIYCQLDALNTFAADYMDYRTYLSGCSFTVSDMTKYDEFRDFLVDNGFSQVRSSAGERVFLKLSDRSYITTRNSLEQQLTYISVLYPLLYALLGAAAFVIARLMTLSRNSEIAIMRGLGSDKKRIYGTFFLEFSVQLILGAAVALGAWTLIHKQLLLSHALITIGFVICGLVGCRLVLKASAEQNLQTLLSDEDSQ